MKKIFIGFILAVASCSAFASSSCFKAPEQFAQNDSATGINKQEESMKKMDESSNPIMEVTMCMMQAAFQSPSDILKGVCGCKQAVKAACKFDTSDLSFSGPAACATFAPWAL